MAQMDRRRFLTHLGLAAAALPLAGVLRPRRACAGGDPPPLRLILWPMMNGAEAQFFWPAAPGAGSVVTDPVRAFASRLSFVRGVAIQGSENHYAVRATYTGQPVGSYDTPDPRAPSLDQVVAAHLADTGVSGLRSLHLGVRPADAFEFYQRYGRSTLFFDATGPVDYEANPVTAFDRLFGAAAPPAPPPPTATAPPDLLAIPDAELAELTARAAGLPTETEKLAQHAAALAALRAEDRAAAGAPTTPRPACGTGPLAAVERLRPSLQGDPRAAYRDEFFSDIFDAQVDVLARAVVCGLTRVATLQAGSADGNVAVPIEGGLPHHNTSHGDQAQFARCQRWYFEKLARLLRALDVPDPLDAASGRTVLDNSAVVVLAECLPSTHASQDVPALIAGGLGGRLRTGGLLDAPGATNRGLLKALARAFGVPDAATAHFGPDELREVRA